MSSNFTLSSLKTTIQNHVEDTGAPLAANLDTLIQLAEDRVLKDLPLLIFDVRGNVSLTAGTRTAAKPTGAIKTHELYYASGSTTLFLKPRTQAFCLAYAPTTTQAAPRYFADDYSETTYFLAPNPNVNVTAEALFTKRPNSLVTDTTGTWLSQKTGDLLLRAALMMTEMYNIADERVPMWKSEYTSLLQAARVEYRNLLPGDR